MSHIVDDEIKVGLKSGYVVRLFRRHQIHIFAPEGGDRFASLFRLTWSRLPLWARREILGHWRCGGAGGLFRHLVGRIPKIELVGGWSGREALAAVRSNGHHLQFDAAVVREMPDHLVQDLIAHELAHVHQGATGLFYSMPLHVLEQDANELMEAWGFDADAMDDWLAEVGIQSRVSCVNLSFAGALSLGPCWS